MQQRRYDYLDGLRGVAAIQVLFGHCVAAFFPAQVGALGFLVDGDFAVLLFFVMSGFVLTFSFEHAPYAVAENALGRVIRLGIPLAAACAIAYVALSLLPHWYLHAGDLADSVWLKKKHLGGALRAAADITGLSLLTGCSNTTLFGFLAPYLPSIESSANGPTWSLHIELWGSMLVQLLVLSRARSTTRYYAVAGASILLIGGNALVVFLIGHAAALVMRSSAIEAWHHRRSTRVLAALALAGGVFLAEHRELHGLFRLEKLSMLTSVLRPYAWFYWNKEVAAVLVFGAVLILLPLQVILRAKPLLWLGKMSFAVYLLHVPILMSVGVLAYLTTWPFGGLIAGIAGLTTVLGVTLLFAPIFERLVDRPAIRFSRMVRRESPTPAVARQLEA